MALLLVKLSEYLEDHGIGTQQVDLFRTHRPEEPLACVSLHQPIGSPPDPYGTREKPGVQVVARAASGSAALQKIYAVFGLLQGRQNWNLGDGIDVLTVLAVVSPHEMGIEGTKAGIGYLASVRFEFDLRRPST